MDEWSHGDHKTIRTTYNGLLNTSGWACGKCVAAAMREAGLVTVIVWVGLCVLISAFIIYLWLHAKMGLGGAALALLSFTGMVAGLGVLFYWSSQDRDAHGQAIALRYNRKRLRAEGYEHFGEGHLKTDTVDDILRRSRAPGRN